MIKHHMPLVLPYLYNYQKPAHVSLLRLKHASAFPLQLGFISLVERRKNRLLHHLRRRLPNLNSFLPPRPAMAPTPQPPPVPWEQLPP